MQDNELNRLTRAAILAALVCIATIVIPIPLPGGGYANAGDIVLLVAAYILGPGLGAAAAGIGSGVADLILGYSAYAPGTFVIKAADAAAAGVGNLVRFAGDLAQGHLQLAGVWRGKE